MGWASPGCPDNQGSRIGGPRRFRHHIRRSFCCTCPPSSRLVCGFPRDRCLKNPKHQRHWTLSVRHGVAVIRCLRITPAGECRWCMRDGPGWGQRAAEEMFGIDQFFRAEKLRAIMRACIAGTQGGAAVTLFWAATLIAIIIAPRRACAIRVPLRPAASEGGDVRICAKRQPQSKYSNANAPFETSAFADNLVWFPPLVSA